MTVALNLASSIALLACVYGLINIGFVLLFRTTGVPSFAQGHLAMLGGMVMFSAQRWLGGYLLPAIVTVAAAAAFGWLLYPFLMRFLLGAEEFTKAMVTFMLAIIVLQAATLGWGTQPHAIGQPLDTRIGVGDTNVSVMLFVTIFVLLALVALLYVVLEKTTTGVRMQALAENETLSMYAGIRVHRLSAVAWASAVALAAVAGILYSQKADINLLTAEVGLAAFPAAVIGGLSSIPGALVGGLALAATQGTVNYFVGGSYGLLVVYAATLLVLIARPQGLMGTVAGQRI
jgi:branched-chain amino acid transport system permease protein